MSLFCFKIPSWMPYCVLIVFVSLLSSSVSFSVIWFSCPWQFQRVLIQYFVKYPAFWVYLLFPSWLHWGYGVWEECHRSQTPFSSHYVRAIWYSNYIIDDANLDCLVKVVCSRCLYCKVFLFILYFWTWETKFSPC